MIWTFLKKCWEKGWVYHGVDVMPWCPRCATAISQHEIVTDGYAELTHQSVTLRFPLRDAAGQPRRDAQTGLPESLLVWTTTPWTLSSNVAAAVGPELTYAKVRQGDEVFYLAKGTLHMLKGSYELLGELKGKEMEGWAYDGPFDELPAEQQPGGFTQLKELTKNRQAQRAAGAPRDPVGRGGRDRRHRASCTSPPAAARKTSSWASSTACRWWRRWRKKASLSDGFGWLSGMHVSEVPQPIFDDLKRKGPALPGRQTTPTAIPPAGAARPSWSSAWWMSGSSAWARCTISRASELTAEEKARSLRYQIMDVVDQIQWIPDFGHAREMDWLRNMHDWMISKKRYWGLALPIWVCEKCQQFEVIGDEKELQVARGGRLGGLRGPYPAPPVCRRGESWPARNAAGR